MFTPEILIEFEAFQKNHKDWKIPSSFKEVDICENYVYYYRERKDNLDNPDSTLGEIYHLLIAACDLELAPDDAEKPLQIKAYTTTSRSSSIDDFKKEQIKEFLNLIELIENPELGARIADINWLRLNDYNSAKKAINLYIANCDNLYEDNYEFAIDRLTRAANLAMSLGKGHHLVTKVFKKTDEYLDVKYEKEKWNHILSLLKIESLLGNGESKIFDIGEETAAHFIKENQFHHARIIFNKLADFANEDSKREKYRLEVAKTYEKEVEYRLESDNPSYFSITHIVEKTIQAYRLAGNNNCKINDLHELLLKYQEKSRREYVTHETNFRKNPEVANLFDKAVDKILNDIKGEDFFEILLILFKECKFPNRQSIKSRVEKHLKNSVSMMFATTKVDNSGRIVGRKPAPFSNDPSELEAAIKAEMYSQVRINHSVEVQTLVLPVLNFIRRNVKYTLDDINQIISNNPFIPRERELIFTKGLNYGFKFDFMVSNHLLVPQLENSIRYLLKKKDIITSKYDADGIQDEYSLNKLLDMDETEKIFTPNVLFDLKATLIERFGYNYRNKLAHGLIHQNNFKSIESIYVWWLTLKLCLVPQLLMEQK